MTVYHPFRFAVQILGAASRQDWIEKVCKAEALGFSSILFGDHLHNQFAPLTALAVAANATRTLRIGTNVLGNDFRHPVMLAREAATLDILSEGRLELGLGTGWFFGDYQKSGIIFDPPSVRVSRFIEAVRIIKGFFTEGQFTFDGQYYRVNELDGLPKSIQKPHPPIIIGGGSKRILSFAALEADIIGINIRTTPQGWLDYASITTRAMAEKVEWVRQAAGSRFDNLELNTLILYKEITDNRRQAVENILSQWEVSEETFSVNDALASPSFLVGSVDQIADELQIRREKYGISYISVYEPIEPFAPVVARLAGK